jgi:hypothetical protein
VKGHQNAGSTSGRFGQGAICIQSGLNWTDGGSSARSLPWARNRRATPPGPSVPQLSSRTKDAANVLIGNWENRHFAVAPAAMPPGLRTGD